MRFTLIGGTNDHEAGPSRTNQEDEEEPIIEPMEIIPYIRQKNRGPGIPTSRV